MTKRIAITGGPRAGKSTTGRRLAAETGLPLTSTETMESPILDCPPLREDIKHAQLCQSIDASGTCIDPLRRSYFVFGKWSIAGRSFVIQEDECNFIRSVIKEIDPLKAKYSPTANCSYPLPDQPSRLTRLW